VTSWALLGVAAALGLERACYVWIARAPGAFRRWCAQAPLARFGEPLVILRTLFYGFKVFQLSLFAGWCYLYGEGSLVPAARGLIPLGLGGTLIVVGQVLNWSVFYRLGTVGVFFGDRLGHEVRWSRGFPFSVLSHPQYVGTVLSIWGLFLIMRFPHDDWSLLPAIETVYYVVGAWLEGRGEAELAGVSAGPPAGLGRALGASPRRAWGDRSIRTTAPAVVASSRPRGWREDSSDARIPSRSA